MWECFVKYWNPKIHWREYLWGIAGALTGGAATCYLVTDRIFGGDALQVVSAAGTLAAGIGAFYAGYVALDLEKKRIGRESAARDAGSKVCYQIVATELGKVSANLAGIVFSLRNLSVGLNRAKKMIIKEKTWVF